MSPPSKKLDPQNSFKIQKFSSFHKMIFEMYQPKINVAFNLIMYNTLMIITYQSRLESSSRHNHKILGQQCIKKQSQASNFLNFYLNICQTQIHVKVNPAYII